MPSAERTIELYGERLLKQRLAANEAAHARLRRLLVAAGRRKEASVLERARGTAWRDIAANPAYVAANAKARRALPRGTRGPPLPRPPVAVEEVVRGKAWKTFEGCARGLVAAWGEDRRLLLVTATCRNDPSEPWRRRFERVTARRDAVLAALSGHRVWGASIFDVQRRNAAGGGFSPHWHVLLVTDAARVGAVLEALEPLRGVALDVAHSDNEGWRADADPMPAWRRRRSWLRVLAYCAKVWPPRRALALPRGWNRVLADLSAEPGFRERTSDGAVAARAAHVVNRCAGLFCRRDRKVKVLPAMKAVPARTGGAPRRRRPGRPDALLDPAIVARVAAGEMDVGEGARTLGVDRKTMRRHRDLLKEAGLPGSGIA